MAQRRQLTAITDFRGGLNVDSSPDLLSPHELLQADNVEVVGRGALRQRGGTVALNAQAYQGTIRQVFEWVRANGEVWLMAVDDSKLYRVNEIDGTLSEVTPVVRSPITWFVFQDHLYFSDGEYYFVYDGEELDSTPVLSPDAAPILKYATSSGNVYSGTYHGVVTFVDGDGVESFPSPSASVTIPWSLFGRRILWEDIPIGPPGTQARRLYRAREGSYGYRFVTEIEDNSTTTYIDTLSNSALGEELSEELDSSLNEVVKCKYILYHTASARFFAAGNPDDVAALYFSEPNDPYTWKITSILYPSSNEGPVTGLSILGDAVLVWYRHTVWVWRGIFPDTDATWEPLSAPEGAVSGETITLTPQSVTFLGEGGLYALSPSLLGLTGEIQPGQELFVNLAKDKVMSILENISQKEQTVGIYDGRNERYLLAYTEEDEGPNDSILVYDWSTKSFTRWLGLESCALLYRQNGDVLIGTEGYILRLGEGDTDQGRPIVPVIHTPPYNLALFQEKQFNRLFATWEMEEGVDLIAEVWVDGRKVREYPLHEEASNLGLITSRLPIKANGNRIQIRFVKGNGGTPFTLYNLGIEWHSVWTRGTEI